MKHPRRADDPRPHSALALKLGDAIEYLSDSEAKALAPLAQIHHALGASPDEIAEILKAKLAEIRAAKRFFQQG